VWEPNPPDVTDSLRQGDLVADVCFMQVRSRPEIDGNGRASIKIRVRQGVVITPCCTITQKGVVELAEVQGTRDIDPSEDFYRGMMNTSWPPETGTPIVYDGFPLVSIPGVLEPKTHQAIRYASFLSTASFEGDISWLRTARLARMTPEARRDLRVRLSLYWGRAEPEDADILAARGVQGNLFREAGAPE
jgi:hypothetical protein